MQSLLEQLSSLLDPHERVESPRITSRRILNFSTIDWNLDLARERERRRDLQKLTGIEGVLAKIWDLCIDAVLLFVIGGCLGLLAGFIDISEMWIVDLRRGFKSITRHLFDRLLSQQKVLLYAY